MKTITLAAIFFAVTGSAARADSVDTTDKLTVFGHIERMDQNELVLTASFASANGAATKELKIPRNRIVKIEFDDTTFNPGGPPAIGARPPKTGAVQQRKGQDVAVMVDGTRQPCDGATIDNHRILHCGKQEIPESDVLRIFLARQ